MPGITGGETFRRLREQRPGLKVVFMSGYTDDEVLRRGVVLSEVAFVEKPFEPAQLARVVRETLDR
jgi:two-component system cell cycle sensor histidine kinase/response regulator CckA